MNAKHKFLPPPDAPAPVQKFASGWKFPAANDRLTINGRTGSGKTQFAMWLFAESADFNKKPWIFIDFKGETLLKQAIGEDAIEVIAIDKPLPDNPGIYVVRPDPQDPIQRIVDFLWKIYRQENVGVFLDEATMIPELKGVGNSGGPYQTLLSQGRSKNIPVWTLIQRPVNVNNMVYSESNMTCAFKLKSTKDFDTLIEKAIPEDTKNFQQVWGRNTRLPDFHSRWYDDNQGKSWFLNPAPSADEILNILFHRVDKMKEKRSI